MGLETLGGFQDSVNHALGERRQGNERLDQWINEAHVELFAELDLQGRRTCGTTSTVIDQRTYNIPPTLIAVLVLLNSTTKKRLIRTSIENFQGLDQAKIGSPTRYSRVDDLLYVHPLPNIVESLQIFYIKEPAALALSTATSELPSMFDRVIHLVALRNALIDLNETERATTIFQIAQNKMRALPTEEWLESDGPREGIQIARSFEDLQRDSRRGTDEVFQGRILL
ncbi:hypothetical protein LCGC14_1653010 [marine sediment metagenome]|uniref:Uncharacterized protein n=1 Tax=marine sediment metagenome TaxID=412755 RepID=A0A0F9KWI2_9ZZZZ